MLPSSRSSHSSSLDAIHFNITRSCNLGCAFCYAKATRKRSDEHVPLETVEMLAEDAAELGAKRAILSGGEPFMRSDWRSVAQLFEAKGMEISFATNGTLIDDDVANELSRYSKVSVAVSVDGDEPIHDRIRAQVGAFQRTAAGLAALRARRVWFHVNVTLFRQNLSEIAFFARLARDLECDVRLSLLHPNGRGLAMRNDALLPEEILRVREFCHVLRRRGVNVYVNLPPLLQYLEDIIPTRGPACGWATRFCGVLANGDVTVCGVAADEQGLVAGSLREQRFRDIWVNAPLFHETRSLHLSDLQGVCGRCPFREFCGGACRLSAFREAGSFVAPYALCQQFYEEGYIPEALLDPLAPGGARAPGFDSGDVRSVGRGEP